MKAELHSAFVWDCHECGRENFERAIEGGMEDAVIEAAEEHLSSHLVAPDAHETDDGAMEAEFLTQKVVVAPAYVECPCGASFKSEIAFIQDGDEFGPLDD